MKKMERCILCGKEFEPLPLPEFPEIFGMKPPHKTICPVCFLKGLRDLLDIGVKILEELEKRE